MCHFNFKAGYQAVRHVQSQGGIGGSHTTHNSLGGCDVIPKMYNGLLISDNIQMGVGKLQHWDNYKVDQSTPCQVFTNNVRAVLPDGLSENETVFLDPANKPCNFEFHLLLIHLWMLL